MLENVSDYLSTHEDRFVQDLIEFLRIPSISTLSSHGPDVYRAACWLSEKLRSLDFPTVQMVEGSGHPLVVAEWEVGDWPTLLIYGHYDVQPVDPVNEWQGNPFEPRIDGNNIYARGATDDKGQIMLVLAALEAWIASNGTPPINIKLLFEGEEEAGGESIHQYVRQHADDLTVDGVLICDTHMNSLDKPSLITGLRGIVYTEIEVVGAAVDLHSGSYGGVAPNPLQALCQILTSLKGEDGSINIPGIYEPLDVSQKERDFWRDNDESLTRRLLQEMGVNRLFGENNLSPHERLGLRPTLEVHGIRGGFTDEGAKTVIPSRATAKVSMRLPPDMNPSSAFQLMREAIDRTKPGGYGVEVRSIHEGAGVAVDTENALVLEAVEAISTTYGKQPVFMREGGSIPIAALFDSQLQAPVVLMGFGLPDDRAHGPNEKFSLAQFNNGMRCVADYLGRLRSLKGGEK